MSQDDYDRALRELSEPTEEEKAHWPKDPLVPFGKPFADERGAIYPMVDLMMRSAVLIESKKGSLRANHCHLTDWHYCYVVEGEIEYYHRPHNTLVKPELIKVRKGGLVFTPPMVDHAMKFPHDSIFLTLGRNARDQTTYEADIVRVPLVEP